MGVLLFQERFHPCHPLGMVGLVRPILGYEVVLLSLALLILLQQAREQVNARLDSSDPFLHCGYGAFSHGLRTFYTMLAGKSMSTIPLWAGVLKLAYSP